MPISWQPSIFIYSSAFWGKNVLKYKNSATDKLLTGLFWVYPDMFLDAAHADHMPPHEYFIEDDEWEVANLEEAFLSNGRVGYQIVYTLHLKRKPLFYSMILILPIMTIYFLSGLSFFLPSDTGEKVAFAMTVLLAQVVAFATLSDIFPSSNNVPLLLHFVSVIMLHMTLLCLMSVTG